MAHFMKIKKADCKRITKEAYRELDYYKNAVDRTKSGLNLTLGTNENYQEAEEFLDACLERFPTKRKDQVILINEVITRPKELKEEDTLLFYQLVKEWTADKLDAVNFYALVHRDEYSEHCHMSFIAIPKGTGQWNAKKMLTTNFLKRYHSELNEYIDQALGYHIQIEKDHKTAHLTHEEYKAEMRRREKEYN